MGYEASEKILIILCIVIIVLGLIGYLSSKKRNAEKNDPNGSPKVDEDTTEEENDPEE